MDSIQTQFVKRALPKLKVLSARLADEVSLSILTMPQIIRHFAFYKKRAKKFFSRFWVSRLSTSAKFWVFWLFSKPRSGNLVTTKRPYWSRLRRKFQH